MQGERPTLDLAGQERPDIGLPVAKEPEPCRRDRAVLVMQRPSDDAGVAFGWRVGEKVALGRIDRERVEGIEGGEGQGQVG